MNAVDVRRMLGITSALLILAGVILLVVDDVPAGLSWPFVLLFWAVGVGMLIGVLMSLGRVAGEVRRQTSQ